MAMAQKSSHRNEQGQQIPKLYILNIQRGVSRILQLRETPLVAISCDSQCGPLKRYGDEDLPAKLRIRQAPWR